MDGKLQMAAEFGHAPVESTCEVAGVVKRNFRLSHMHDGESRVTESGKSESSGLIWLWMMFYFSCVHKFCSSTHAYRGTLILLFKRGDTLRGPVKHRCDQKNRLLLFRWKTRAQCSKVSVAFHKVVSLFMESECQIMAAYCENHE